MAEELGRKADKAFVDEEYETSVQLYSDALQLNPSDAVLFASRAQAYLKLDRYMGEHKSTPILAHERRLTLPRVDHLRKLSVAWSMETGKIVDIS